ncbi:MAG: hypothetical protein ACLP56_14800 [Candidatus Sulfotelmatobacter sp.]
MTQKEEGVSINRLFRALSRRPRKAFPRSGAPPDATEERGVYVIRDNCGIVLHVGRTPRGAKGIKQRLNNHLCGQSSFVRGHLEGVGGRLRNGCTFQYIEVADERERALLEHLATGLLCPLHLGLSRGPGEKS